MLVRLAHSQNYLALSPNKEQVILIGSCLAICSPMTYIGYKQMTHDLTAFMQAGLLFLAQPNLR